MSEDKDCGSDLEGRIADESQDVKALSVEIAQEISNAKLSVLKFVEKLGFLLTHPDEFKRLHGTSLLANSLQNIPSDLLSKDEVHFISVFFIDRAKDHFVVTPATLEGFLSVSNMSNLPDSEVGNILIALSQNFTCQALPQPCRYTYYCIFDALFHNKQKALQKISGDYLYGLITSMESESDPRNLLKLFGMLPTILKAFKLNHLAEEMFSVLECYFPVDFKQRENDITREELSIGLEECLISTPEFGPFCIPMLLEKLDSKLKVAHMESLKVMIRGSNVWSLECIINNLDELQNILKNLLFPGSDAEVTDLAIQVVMGLIARFSSSTVNVHQADSLNQLLEFITASTHIFLSDASLSMFLPATKVLAAVAEASSNGCYHITKTVIPQILALLGSSTGHEEVVLSAFHPILKSTVLYDIWSHKDEEVQKIMTKIPEVLLEVLKKSKTTAGAYICLSEIISCLNEECRQKVFSFIIRTTPRERNQLIRDACSVYVKTVSALYPEETKSQLLSKIASTDGNTIPEQEIGRSIEIFCWASHVLALTPFAISKILGHIASASSVSGLAMAYLRSLCDNLEDEKVLESLGISCKLPENLLSSWIQILRDETKESVKTEENITNVAMIVDAIMKALKSSDQKIVLEGCIPLFLNQSNSDNPYVFSEMEVVLLEGLIGSLRPEISIPGFEKLMKNLVQISITCSSSFAKISAARLSATLVNKHSNEKELEEILNQIMELIDKSKVTPQKFESCQLTCWVTKALVLKAHPKMNIWLDKVISMLSVEAVQMEAAKGIQLILTESDHFLNFNSYCNIRILYKQRVFEIVHTLITLFESTEGNTKVAVSLSIAYLLQCAPRSLLIDRFKKLIKIIVGCLECEDSNVLAAVLEVVCKLLADKEAILEEYTDTFIPRCIHHATNPSMKVRMEALDCIYYYGRYQEIILLPYKNIVVLGLNKCLDDKKRLVRQKAVRARNRWFLLGTLPNKKSL